MNEQTELEKAIEEVAESCANKITFKGKNFLLQSEWDKAVDLFKNELTNSSILLAAKRAQELERENTEWQIKLQFCGSAKQSAENDRDYLLRLLSKNKIEADIEAMPSNCGQAYIAQLSQYKTAYKEAVEALNQKFDGLSLHEYLFTQFPVTQGHIPLRDFCIKQDEVLSHPIAIETMKGKSSACPHCKSPLIHANIGGGSVDTYCEECGWPDEERK